MSNPSIDWKQSSLGLAKRLFKLKGAQTTILDDGRVQLNHPSLENPIEFQPKYLLELEIDHKEKYLLANPPPKCPNPIHCPDCRSQPTKGHVECPYMARHCIGCTKSEPDLNHICPSGECQSKSSKSEILICTNPKFQICGSIKDSQIKNNQ